MEMLYTLIKSYSTNEKHRAFHGLGLPQPSVTPVSVPSGQTDTDSVAVCLDNPSRLTGQIVLKCVMVQGCAISTGVMTGASQQGAGRLARPRWERYGGIDIYCDGLKLLEIAEMKKLTSVAAPLICRELAKGAIATTS